LWRGRRHGRELAQHSGEVRQFADLEPRVDRGGEIGLHAAVVRQGEQANHYASGVARGTGREESFPGTPVSRAWPEGVTIGQIGQRAGFGAQSGDDVMVIDDMDGLACFGPASAWKRQDEGTAEISLDAVVMDTQMQAMTD